MSKIWLIDNKAVDISRWKSYIRDSLSSYKWFLSDLNADLDEKTGLVSFRGFVKDENGELKRDQAIDFLGDETDELYGTNRGALTGQALSPDGFDEYICEALELPLEERMPLFEKRYQLAVQGDGDALYDAWAMIPDTAKLIFTLHMWERYRKGKLHSAVWGAILSHSWPHGKIGPMMFRANLTTKEVVEMFRAAPREVLMSPEEFEMYRQLPKEITVYRGVSSISKYRKRGFSWTRERDQAEWFALVNTITGEPIILESTFSREALLKYCDFEWEMVINPFIPDKETNIHTLPTFTVEAKKERLNELRELLEKYEPVT